MNTPHENLRLGVLGMSEGNGHPYSWSAIFNGYDVAAMAPCPFPVIPQYLARQSFPRDTIPGATVTHVWAQDRSMAEDIARASLIPNVVDRYEQMIGEVDAILLARDDGENHVEMSIPFLDAGLPIYIDKPVALTMADLDTLYEHQGYEGQIFSCSALRFSPELQLSAEKRAALGSIRHVQARVPNRWEKYGAHIVDPVLNILGLYGQSCEVTSTRLIDSTVVSANWGSVAATFTCLGPVEGDIKLSIFGDRDFVELEFSDSFAAFKAALEAFVDGVRTNRAVTPRADQESLVSILEAGYLP